MLMRVATIGDGGEARLLAAAKHNLRETGGDHIDGEKSCFNAVMAGPRTAAEVVELAAAKRHAAGIALKRKDATLAGEIIFGLPPTTTIDVSAYLHACLDWVRSTFGADVVLSAVIHLDEGAPHAHILMLPVRQGKWRASDVFGRKPELKVLLDTFFRDVASGFGLKRAPERLGTADRRALVRDVFAHLQAIAAPVMRCPTWAVVRDLIEEDPIPFAEQLGIPIKRRLKTLAQLKVSPGKGPRRDDTYIGVEAGKDRHLSCVGVAENRGPSGALVAGVGSGLTPGEAADRGGARPAAARDIEVRSTPLVRTESGSGGPSWESAPSCSQAPVSAAVSAGTAHLVATIANAVSTKKAFSAGATEAAAALQARRVEASAPTHGKGNDTAPVPALRPPKRYAGRLGLHTLRDLRKAAEAPDATPGNSPDPEGITRQRDGDTAAAQWDSTRGEFAEVKRAPGQSGVVRATRGAAGDPVAIVRQREDEIPAERWDATLGEHIAMRREPANCCRL